MTHYWEFHLLYDLGISILMGYGVYGFLCWRHVQRERRVMARHELDTDGQYQLKGYDARPNVRKA